MIILLLHETTSECKRTNIKQGDEKIIFGRSVQSLVTLNVIITENFRSIFECNTFI